MIRVKISLMRVKAEYYFFSGLDFKMIPTGGFVAMGSNYI